MKRFLLLALLSLSAQAVETELTGFKLYVPEGFDDNDTIEVIAVGSMPDNCHQAPKAKIEHGQNGFTISMSATVIERKDCRKISIPYQEKISLGTLVAGSYEVRTSTQKLPLKVVKAISTLQDDVMYANVTNIIEEDEGRTVWLIGSHPATCVQEQPVELKKSGDSVWVILPKVTLEGDCIEESRPFKIAVEIPYDASMKRGVMLHVRVMDGRSLNLLYQNLVK